MEADEVEVPSLACLTGDSMGVSLIAVRFEIDLLPHLHVVMIFMSCISLKRGHGHKVQQSRSFSINTSLNAHTFYKLTTDKEPKNCDTVIKFPYISIFNQVPVEM